MSDEVKNEGTNTEAPVATPKGQSPMLKYALIGIAVIAVLGYGSRYVMGMMGMAAVNADLKAHGVTVSGNPAAGNATYNYTDEKGNTATIGTGTKVPDDFPKDVPLYKGTILSSTSATQDNKKMFSVSLQTTDSFDTVVGFYKNELASNGWKIAQEMNMAAGYSMYVSQNESQQINVMIQNADGKTTVTLTTGAKE